MTLSSLLDKDSLPSLDIPSDLLYHLSKRIKQGDLQTLITQIFFSNTFINDVPYIGSSLMPAEALSKCLPRTRGTILALQSGLKKNTITMSAWIMHILARLVIDLYQEVKDTESPITLIAMAEPALLPSLVVHAVENDQLLVVMQQELAELLFTDQVSLITGWHNNPHYWLAHDILLEYVLLRSNENSRSIDSWISIIKARLMRIVRQKFDDNFSYTSWPHDLRAIERIISSFPSNSSILSLLIGALLQCKMSSGGGCDLSRAFHLIIAKEKKISPWLLLERLALVSISIGHASPGEAHVLLSQLSMAAVGDECLSRQSLIMHRYVTLLYARASLYNDSRLLSQLEKALKLFSSVSPSTLDEPLSMLEPLSEQLILMESYLRFAYAADRDVLLVSIDISNPHWFYLTCRHESSLVKGLKDISVLFYPTFLTLKSMSGADSKLDLLLELCSENPARSKLLLDQVLSSAEIVDCNSSVLRSVAKQCFSQPLFEYLRDQCNALLIMSVDPRHDLCQLIHVVLIELFEKDKIEMILDRSSRLDFCLGLLDKAIFEDIDSHKHLVGQLSEDAKLMIDWMLQLEHLESASDAWQKYSSFLCVQRQSTLLAARVIKEFVSKLKCNQDTEVNIKSDSFVLATEEAQLTLVMRQVVDYAISTPVDYHVLIELLALRKLTIDGADDERQSLSPLSDYFFFDPWSIPFDNSNASIKFMTKVLDVEVEAMPRPILLGTKQSNINAPHVGCRNAESKSVRLSECSLFDLATLALWTWQPSSRSNVLSNWTTFLKQESRLLTSLPWFLRPLAMKLITLLAMRVIETTGSVDDLQPLPSNSLLVKRAIDEASRQVLGTEFNDNDDILLRQLGEESLQSFEAGFLLANKSNVEQKKKFLMDIPSSRALLGHAFWLKYSNLIDDDFKSMINRAHEKCNFARLLLEGNHDPSLIIPQDLKYLNLFSSSTDDPSIIFLKTQLDPGKKLSLQHRLNALMNLALNHLHWNPLQLEANFSDSADDATQTFIIDSLGKLSNDLSTPMVAQLAALLLISLHNTKNNDALQKKDTNATSTDGDTLLSIMESRFGAASWFVHKILFSQELSVETKIQLLGKARTLPIMMMSWPRIFNKDNNDPELIPLALRHAVQVNGQINLSLKQVLLENCDALTGDQIVTFYDSTLVKILEIGDQKRQKFLLKCLKKVDFNTRERERWLIEHLISLYASIQMLLGWLEENINEDKLDEMIPVLASCLKKAKMEQVVGPFHNRLFLPLKVAMASSLSSQLYLVITHHSSLKEANISMSLIDLILQMNRSLSLSSTLSQLINLLDLLSLDEDKKGVSTTTAIFNSLHVKFLIEKVLQSKLPRVVLQTLPKENIEDASFSFKVIETMVKTREPALWVKLVKRL